MVRLYTFNISHFAEKARWALDRTGVAYEERVLVPGPHLRTIRRLGQGATSVPVLVDGERVVQGSSAIIDYIDERWLAGDAKLTPTDPEVVAKLRRGDRTLTRTRARRQCMLAWTAGVGLVSALSITDANGTSLAYSADSYLAELTAVRPDPRSTRIRTRLRPTRARTT